VIRASGPTADIINQIKKASEPHTATPQYQAQKPMTPPAPVAVPEPEPEPVEVPAPTTTAYVEENEYPHLSHLLLTDEEDDIWWDNLAEGPRPWDEEKDPTKDLNKMLCLNPAEICIITFLPKIGADIELRRESTMTAL
jgi:hypothetical protein